MGMEEGFTYVILGQHPRGVPMFVTSGWQGAEVIQRLAAGRDAQLGSNGYTYYSLNHEAAGRCFGERQTLSTQLYGASWCEKSQAGA